MATLVTECDLKKEELTRQKLSRFVEILENNFRLIKNLASAEDWNVEQIWIQSIRYELLTRSCPDATPYPNDLVEEVKAECMEEMVRRLLCVGKVVSEAVDSYNRILVSFQELEKIAYRLDWTQQSELILGSDHRKPLECFLSQGYNICFELETLVTEFQNVFNAIDPRRSGTVDRFQRCLQIPEHFQSHVTKFLLNAQIISE